MLIVDAHEDLAYNILSFGRDYALSAEEIRQQEQGTDVPALNGDTLLGYPEYQKGQVAVVFGTLFVVPERHKAGAWDHQSYKDVDDAHALYRGQVETYYRLCDDHPDKFHLIQSKLDLEAVLSRWEQKGGAGVVSSEHPAENPPDFPVGLVTLMEGAEGVRSPSELEEWWRLGVRIIGPAWSGTRFCGGTGQPGPLTKEGFTLLEGMAEFGFALDISHMDEKAVLQALDSYPGVIIASHANAASLLKGMDSNRHLSDQVIRKLIERGGVVGVIPCNRFLQPSWSYGDSKEQVSLQHVVAHIDYLSQMAGDAQHAGLGTDFDGGWGWQSAPFEIDTIADLQKQIPLLAEKGYSEADIEAILGNNWIDQLRRILPEDV
jgi:membrane dipeptidase